MFIYCIEHGKTRKQYIGQTHNPEARKQAHFSGSSNCVALTNAIKKYGSDQFEFILLERCGSQEELDAKEIYWIRALKTQIPYGYNLKAGGAGGGPCTEETKLKISLAHKGRKKSKEHVEKLRLSHLGKPLTMEHKAKLRAINLGKKMHKDAVEKTRQFWLGRQHSEESRRKMSESSKGFKHSKESKEKIRKAMVGRVYEFETLQRMSVSAQQRAKRGLDRDTCKHGHKMTEENTYRPLGKLYQRQCRTCIRKNAAASRARRKVA